MVFLERRRPVSVLLIAFAFVALALVPAAASEADMAATRVAVGLVDFPMSLAEGDFYDGAPVVLSVPSIRMIVVRTVDPEGFIANHQDDPNVRYVHKDIERPLLLERAPVPPPGDVGALLTPDDPQYGAMYGPQQVRANLAWSTTLGDLDAAVCVVDTGVRRTHEDLGTARYLGGHDFVNGDSNADDDQGHGTHVAGTAVGGVNNAVGVSGMGNTGYYSVKVLNAVGMGTWANIAAGITWCADNGIPRTVISMSLGCACFDQSAADAIHYAFATKGMLVVAASGNDYCDNCVLFPGRHAEAIGVACTNSAETTCDFTSKGPEVDVAGPGDEILSTCYTSDAAYCTKSGTSMSTPHVSGLLALVWSHETSLAAADLWQRLNETSEDLGAAGKDATYGWGRVDAECLITNTLCSIPPPPPPSLTDVFVEAFGTGAPGWNLTGLWHESGCRQLSPSWSLAYNKAGSCATNFDTGASNSGEASSPSILIPAGISVARLRLASWYDTEGGSTWDKKLVLVSVNNGTFMQIFQETGTARSWNTIDLDVSAHIGKAIRVKLRFDTVDHIANSGEGWYVDDLALAVDINLGDPTVPRMPTSLTIVGGPGVGQLKAMWSAPWHGGSPITHYNVYAADTAAGPFDLISTLELVGTPSASSFIESGLGDGVTRFYRVSATNAIGEGNLTLPANGTTFTLPGTPAALNATAGPGAGEISLGWVAPSTGGTPITAYRIYRASNASGPFALHATSAAPSYVDSGLPEATSYWYEVSAVNLVGEGETSDAASARTFARPTAPLNLSARPGGATLAVDLSWQAPVDAGGTAVTSYRVYRDGVLAGNASGLTFRDHNRDPTRVYLYAVAAVNVVGAGALSNEDCSRANPWPSGLAHVCEIEVPSSGRSIVLPDTLDPRVLA